MEKIRLDTSDIARLERGIVRAERSAVAIGRAGAAAARFGSGVANRAGRLSGLAAGFLEGTEFEDQARRADDVIQGTLAGARSGGSAGGLAGMGIGAGVGALFGGGGAIPGAVIGKIIGEVAGTAAGAGLGAKLASQIEQGRIDAAKGIRQAEQEGRDAAARVGNIAVEAQQQARFREALEQAEAARKLMTVDLGLGDPARLAALRRAVRGGR